MRTLIILASALAASPAMAASGPFFSLSNTNFVVLIAFLVFIGILVYFKVPGLLGGMLDKRAEGISVFNACVSAGRARLRAILLTTVTTVFGLTPLMFEQSFQAKFLVPMAITISYGLMSATLIMLLILPCVLLIGDDLKRLLTGRRVHAEPPARDEPVSEASIVTNA